MMDPAGNSPLGNYRSLLYRFHKENADLFATFADFGYSIETPAMRGGNMSLGRSFSFLANWGAAQKYLNLREKNDRFQNVAAGVVSASPSAYFFVNNEIYKFRLN